MYYIDLDLSPEERWTYVVTDKIQEIRYLISVLRDNAANIFGNDVFSKIDTYMPYLTKSLPKDYYNEIIGISAAINLTVGDVVLYNIFYEFYSACTSIVMGDSLNQMYHGRNLDFGFLLKWDIRNKTRLIRQIMRPLVVKLEFVRNNQTLFSAVNFAGYVGILTAVKQNKFSLSVNERYNLNGDYTDIVEWIRSRKDHKWLAVITRDVMENSNDFKDAQKMLALPKLIPSCYFILAGNKPSQGTIITRGPVLSELRNLAIDGNASRFEEGVSYLVQTNYDREKLQSLFDDRHRTATICMEKLGRSYPIYTLYNVLSTVPVLNKLTVYTAVMNVIEGTLDIWFKDCPEPC